MMKLNLAGNGIGDSYIIKNSSSTADYGTIISDLDGDTGVETQMLINNGCVNLIVVDTSGNIVSNNKMLCCPNYNSLINISVGGENTDETVTVTEDGFLQGWCSCGEDISIPLFLRLAINGQVMFASYGNNRVYDYIYSPVFPVKKGDVVRSEIAGATGYSAVRVFSYR